MPEKASLTKPQTWGINHKGASHTECWGRSAQAWGCRWSPCWACSRSWVESQHDLHNKALSARHASQVERQRPVTGEERRGQEPRHSQMTQVPANCRGNLELLEIRVVLSSGTFQTTQCQGFTSNFTLYFFFYCASYSLYVALCCMMTFLYTHLFDVMHSLCTPQPSLPHPRSSCSSPLFS